MLLLFFCCGKFSLLFCSVFWFVFPSLGHWYVLHLLSQSYLSAVWTKLFILYLPCQFIFPRSSAWTHSGWPHVCQPDIECRALVSMGKIVLYIMHHNINSCKHQTIYLSLTPNGEEQYHITCTFQSVQLLLNINHILILNTSLALSFLVCTASELNTGTD